MTDDKFGQYTADIATSASRTNATDGSKARPAAEKLLEAAATLPFHPHPLLANQHLQTIWSNRIERHPAGRRLSDRSESSFVEAEDGDRLQLQWSLTEHDPTAVLIVLHGLTGCAESNNVMSVAAKGYAAGFDVVRVDLRNSLADDTSLGIGHAGRSEDLRSVIDHVRGEYPGTPLTVIGFSLGGNITLKAMGEYGSAAPSELKAVATISVPIDLDAACHAIDRTGNWIYRSYFLKRLAGRYELLRARHPERFPYLELSAIKSIRAWDNAIVAPLSGFVDAEDYYSQSSALRTLAGIRIPSLLIQAQDDPFIPFDSFRRPVVQNHGWLKLLGPARGGHVGFYAAPGVDGELDRFWAENRALAFCAASVELPWPPPRGLDSLAVKISR
ncbi:MAG: YheT family hydrolase [Acidobacteriota bacterium]